MRKFIITLHYKSPAAYRYVRETINNVLPHQKTIRRWYKSINASPGHVTDFMSKKCSGRPEAATLCIDDMHIMKKLEKCGDNLT